MGGLSSASSITGVCIAFLGLAACQAGEVTVVESDGSDGGPSLGTLVAQVELRPGDSALAESLGWDAGVPGARVRILQNGTAEWQTAMTDSTGTAIVESLEPGLYFTYVERVLSQTEASQASGAARGFGDGSLVRVGADTVEHLYRTRSSRRTGLVISEVSNAQPPSWEVPGAFNNARGNRFFEVYNLTGRTHHLDGLIFGIFPIGLFCDGCANSCATGEPVRTDSTGLYYRALLQFPGSGSQFPIEPGEVKLIAAAAQDHREIHEDMLDLRDADFEIGASNFADNPAVPNMEEIGANVFHLTHLSTGTNLFFLSEAFDPTTLPVTWRSVRGSQYRKIPVELLIDVASTHIIWPERDETHIRCDPMIHPSIDGFPGGFQVVGGPREDYIDISFQREMLTTEDGIPVLMDTNTSAADFSRMRYTPGGLPDGGQ